MSEDFEDEAPTNSGPGPDPGVLGDDDALNDLLAAVLADPDNDELRLVYGDYLLDRDDPRGEFIQLQLRAGRDEASRARERQLLAEHVAAWCGPLYRALQPGVIVFQRGFLWGCRVWDGSPVLRSVIGHPMWRTVGDLDSSDQSLVTDACTRSVRRVRTTPWCLADLARVAHEPAVERVELIAVDRFREYTGQPSREHLERVAWPRILDVGALTHLRSLYVRAVLDATSPPTRDLLDSRLGRQLETLELVALGGSLAPWENVLRDHPSLRQIHLHLRHSYDDEGFDLDQGGALLERDADGTIRPIVRVDRDPDGEAAIRAVCALPDHYRTVELVGDRYVLHPVGRLVDRLRQRFGEVIVRPL